MSGFWEWALDAYAREGVADACVELQDARGQNVPLMLWLVWAARSGRALPLQQAADLARAYEQAAGARLRSARRALKSEPAGLDPGDREALRDQVKAVELEGERTLMAALAQLASPAGTAPARPADLLAEAAAAYGAPAHRDVFAPLLTRLGPTLAGE